MSQDRFVEKAYAEGYARGREDAFGEAARIAMNALTQGAKGAEVVAILHLEARAQAAPKEPPRPECPQCGKVNWFGNLREDKYWCGSCGCKVAAHIKSREGKP